MEIQVDWSSVCSGFCSFFILILWFYVTSFTFPFLCLKALNFLHFLIWYGLICTWEYRITWIHFDHSSAYYYFLICCAVCDGTFFPSLLNEMSAVVGCFNERAQKLLDLHLASGFSKCFIWFKGRFHGNHGALIQEGKDLVTYAIINAIAVRKILKKYDKVHLVFA